MNTIIDFTNTFKNNVIISLKDIEKEFPRFYNHRLVEWQKQGYIKKIIRGFYILSDLEINELTSFSIANKIYEPSYISLESALRHYNFIPEQTFAVTSISTRKTNKFKTKTDVFVYSNIKPSLFFGYEIMRFKNFTFKIADREKAILDYLYFHRHFTTEKDLEELRFNIEEIQETIDRKKLENYLLKYNNKKFIKTINNFIKLVYSETIVPKYIRS